MTLLTGRELLALVKDNPEIKNRSVLARMAGYERTTRKGDIVADLGRFTDAVLEAKGVKFDSETRGRAAANETTVHKNGSVLIGAIYSKQAGIGPGDTLSITVDPASGQIVLDVAQRVEGSPLPFKVYEKKPKAVAAAPEATGAEASEATGGEAAEI